MKMIDVLNMMAKGEIKEGTKLIVSTDLDYFEYRYSKGYNMFFNKYSNRINEIECDFYIDEDFLNLEVELIPPKEKKYLVKFNMRWLDKGLAYLNYTKSRNCVIIHGKVDCITYKTHFTKKELQSIQPVREFLEDMEGKYQLIEVTDNEID